MKSSAALLNTTLVDLGFPTYDDFMIEALRSELSARRTVMKQMNVGPVSPILGTQLQLKNSLAIAFDSIDHLIKLRSGLQNQETFLVELDMQLNRVALNSGVRAAHLGDSGRSLGVIGEEIARVSRQVGEEVVTLKREVKNLSSSLKLTTFNISLALLQSEMSDDFVTKQAAAQLSEAEQLSQFGSSAKSICELLDRCSKQSVEQALLGMEQLSSTLGSFDYFLQSLTKILLTIQFAYVTGKTQAARVEGGDAFSRLLSDLRDVSNSARAELSQLGLQVRDVSLKVDQWRQGDIGSM